MWCIADRRGGEVRTPVRPEPSPTLSGITLPDGKATFNDATGLSDKQICTTD